MLVLLPFFCFAAVLSVAVCLGAGFSGWTLAGMLALLFTAFFVAALALLLLVIGALSLLIDMNKPVRKLNGFFCGFTKYVMGVVCAIMRVHVTLTGGEKLPEGRWLLVSNHPSGFDIVTALWGLRRQDVAFIMKPDVLRIPAVGRFAVKIGCLAIDREDDRAALKTILAAADMLKNGVTSFCIYPEGTRDYGKELLPFRNGAFKVAQKAKTPVVVMATEGTEKIMKNFPFRRTDVTLRILAVFPAEQVTAQKTAEISRRARECMERTPAQYENN